MTHESDQHRRTLSIKGMHCPSCDVMVERRLSKVRGIVEVDANHATGRVVIATDPHDPPDDADIARAVEQAGYALGEPADETFWRDITISMLLVIGGYLLLRRFDLSSLAPSTTEIFSLGAVLVIGLVAGASSCMAVTGGLLLAVSAKHNELHAGETPARKFRPVLFFNVGRLASYFVLGGAVGLLGQSLSLGTRATGYVNIAVAIVMILFALSILQVLPKSVRMPKGIARWIANLSDSDHPAAPALLGALTFFLPCGFTQSLQLVALSSGNAFSGATIMFTFALGTLPFLLGIGALGASLKGALSRSFLRFAGIVVLVLAFLNLQTGMALAGVHLLPVAGGPSAAPAEKKGVQEVSMSVTSYGYEPSAITIRAGVPVRWKVNGDGAVGCTSILTIPDLNISKPLTRGENIIEFTASAKGRLDFMCSMGMVRGFFTVI